MHDRKVVRRRRAVLGLLVGCALILLTAYFGEGAGGGLHSIQRGALAVFSPIESVASDAVKPFRDLFGWFGDTFHAKGENKKLRKEVDSLRFAVADANAKLRTSTQLDKITELDGTRGLTDMGLVDAKVVIASSSLWYSTVNINRGSGDGVKVNDAVIDGDGVVGVVTKTASDGAQVLLLTDALSGISAKIARTGVLGFVETGTPGNPNDVLMKRIPRGKVPQVGQMVVTAGLRSTTFPSNFPGDLPIGVVTKVDPNELDTSQLVHIKPYADFHQLDVVQVITKPFTRSAGPKP
ncbi:MAG: rod shape-determining protein MreC [Solirubrobacteraceae bacterium]|nr:rod shape-determining protein MreC [Solirubrobacteraceae bacterium]